MNYLAHIYFSEPNWQQQVGNFMADGVKGSYTHKYPPKVAEGIRRHRQIDHFTDHHPLIRTEVNRMRPHFGRYAPMLLDILLDHILANNFHRYTGRRLLPFVWNFYIATLWNYRHLPNQFRRFIFHFIMSDRLGSYRHLQGLRDSLQIMVDYRGVQIDVDRAIDYLQENRPQLEQLFEAFSTALKEELLHPQQVKPQQL